MDPEIEAMQRRLKEMEDEAAKLKDEHEKVDDAMTASEQANPDEEAAKKQEADARSVFVGQVEYKAKPEDLANAFASCGTVNRVTILHDKFDNPKGFAYVEFLEPDAVSNAILLDGTEVCGRKIKVWPKRSVLSAKGAAKPANVDVNIHDVVPGSSAPADSAHAGGAAWPTADGPDPSAG